MIAVFASYSNLSHSVMKRCKRTPAPGAHGPIRPGWPAFRFLFCLIFGVGLFLLNARAQAAARSLADLDAETQNFTQIYERTAVEVGKLAKAEDIPAEAKRLSEYVKNFLGLHEPGTDKVQPKGLFAKIYDQDKAYNAKLAQLQQSAKQPGLDTTLKKMFEDGMAQVRDRQAKLGALRTKALAQRQWMVSFKKFCDQVEPVYEQLKDIDESMARKKIGESVEEKLRGLALERPASQGQTNIPEPSGNAGVTAAPPTTRNEAASRGIGRNDPLIWKVVTTGFGIPDFALGFFNDQFVGGWGDGSRDGRIATLPDGITWTTRHTAPRVGMYSTAYGNGKYVVGSNWGKVFYSRDGVEWSQSGYSDQSPFYVTFFAGKFIATAGEGRTQYTSADGIKWEPDLVGGDRGGSFASNGTALVAAGFNSIRWSSDGTNWVDASAPPTGAAWLSVGYGAGKFVAVSSNGRIYTSPDGDQWVPQSSPVSGVLGHVCYGGGKFVASGAHGIILESVDGVSWSQDESGTTQDLGCVAWGNGVFVIASGSGDLVVSNSSTPSDNR